MAITIDKYVDITSGVGAGAVATTRSLVGRVFTGSPRVPAGTFLTFSSAAEVGSYFGSGSEEALRANFYFSWISKNVTTAQSIQFARWVSEDTAPRIYSVRNNGSLLSEWQLVSDGAFSLTIGGENHDFTGLNFTTPGVANFAAVAQLVQDAIRSVHAVLLTGTTVGSSATITMADTTGVVTGQSVSGVGIPSGSTVLTVTANTSITISQPATAAGSVQLSFYDAANAQWGNATVTFNPANAGFDFVGGDATQQNATIVVTGGTSGGTDISGIGFLGWLPQAVSNGQGGLLPENGAIWSDGAQMQGLTETLESSANLSNNFGSFLFLTNLNLLESEVLEIAQWNAAQNVMYLYTVGLSESQAAVWPISFAGIGGVAFTLSPIVSEFPEQVPMMIIAATDYTRPNSVQNFMYQIFPGLTPSVSTTTASNSYDAVSVNYYGSTQTAGQIISFYQRGLLQGSSNPTNITDMNAYANEIWLKDAAAVEILNLLLGLAQVPANAQGRSQVLATLQTVIDLALLNGTISVGKILSNAQRAFISNQTGDANAWHQVQNAGYWVDCDIVPIPGVTPVQYEADYLLIYSKDDVIRKVVGTQTLI